MEDDEYCIAYTEHLSDCECCDVCGEQLEDCECEQEEEPLSYSDLKDREIDMRYEEQEEK